MLQRHTRVVENMYHQSGGLITVIVKEGHAHHPHSLQNAKPIADWIEQHMTPSTANRPAFVDAKFAKGYYYSLEPSFIYLKEEDTYATARGPGFTECYDRYDGPTSGRFKMGGMSIIVPKTVAPGKPCWVFTGDHYREGCDRRAGGLLAKGYHILILSPLGSGMTQKQWNDAYKLLVDHGFSNKPVLKGTGPKGGEAYAWAIANPGKVSCIYARNPLMHSLMAGKEQPIDNLAALAKAGVPVLHDCGALSGSPGLDNQTRVIRRNVIRSAAARSRLSSGRAKGTFRFRRKTRSRSWISSSIQPDHDGVRDGVRPALFGRRCLTSLAMAPFPHPAHQTGSVAGLDGKPPRSTRPDGSLSPRGIEAGSAAGGSGPRLIAHGGTPRPLQGANG